MKIIRLHHPLNSKLHFPGPVVLAMGFFDGLHLGHRHVIMTAKRIAQRMNIPLAVLTYDHHPALLYRRFDLVHQKYITLNHDKFSLLRKWGVKRVYLVNYTSSFQSQSPQEFVNHYLVRLKAAAVVAGFDHTYGPKDKANMRLLPKYVQGRMRVITVPDYQIDHRKVSSTWIHEALSQGRIATVNRLLGRTFTTHGVIVRGYRRGRKLGFPTINIHHDEKQQLLGPGVYVTQVKLNGKLYPGMASIGRNVTFGDTNPVTVEINLLHFHQSVYGEVVSVRWLARLRGQVKFANAYALITQMKRDRRATLNYFKLN